MTIEEARSAAVRLRAVLDDVEGRPAICGHEEVHDGHRPGEANLADYLALRRHDLRDLQADLARLGVSSLGRGEAHVRATLRAALRACRALAGDPVPDLDLSGFEGGPAALDANAEALLGPVSADRPVRIMVTLPSSAADDGGALAMELLEAGMDCVRVNTAHDDPASWRRMIQGVRYAATRTGRPCTVLADLGGPKLRVTPLADGPQAVRIRPVKDTLGRTERPGTAVLFASGTTAPLRESVAIPVDGDLFDGLADGDEIVVSEARGRRRTMRVVDVGPTHAIVEVVRTTWLSTGADLHRSATARRPRASGVVGDLVPRPSGIRVAVGDLLMLTSETRPTPLPAPGELARIGCTLPAAIQAVRPGHRVEFDDGTIGGEVVEVDVRRAEALVRVTRTSNGGAKLRGGKGINLPDTDIEVDALSDADLAALDAISPEIDVVGLSFVRSASDVVTLHEQLARRDLDLGIVLKIETPEAFRELPCLLVAAMRAERAGVMIARGDLAVEAGFERTAELQEEILWACEAAHLPAIWATQVLESLAKDGHPSRAEVTDAAMATGAECVMLNKGDHIDEAVRTLDDILRRMTGHQHKKAALDAPTPFLVSARWRAAHRDP